ncbi:hypothetical protein [Flavobacterium salmonis]|uniref:Uncharacterized protein n=1 Tax=Flavobacterium salmonis TaxID=2654844 RepID=A0A6V6Z877_9FLAO|nr:hypothetical protein [Flavobacterium salmonis]CAD0007819.1 hypothetical protein FLAT13_04052 [Flavobacterium salmonis]
MTRIVPFDSNYDQIRKLEKTAFVFLFITALLILLNWFLLKFYSVKMLSPYNDWLELGKTISYVSMIGYLIINIISRVLFHSAEKKKRNDLIDNSFGTKYSDENTIGYYNNDEVEQGIKKLALNSYESSFHTENTLKLMLYKAVIYLIILSVPFLLSIFTKNGGDIVRLLFEISIPMTLFFEFIIMLIYYLNVSEINERFKIEFTNIGKSNLSERDYPKLLIPVMEYYSIKAWANTSLDSKIFKKNNDRISEKWNERKIKLIR